MNNKKFKFKLGLKGRAEIHDLLKERKLILLKEVPETLQAKLEKINVLLEFFLRITL